MLRRSQSVTGVQPVLADASKVSNPKWNRLKFNTTPNGGQSWWAFGPSVPTSKNPCEDTGPWEPLHLHGLTVLIHPLIEALRHKFNID